MRRLFVDELVQRVTGHLGAILTDSLGEKQVGRRLAHESQFEAVTRFESRWGYLRAPQRSRDSSCPSGAKHLRPTEYGTSASTALGQPLHVSPTMSGNRMESGRRCQRNKLGPQSLCAPAGLALSRRGELFVTDAAVHRVVAFASP